MIEVGGKRLLFDPFITGNPMAGGVDPDKLEADYIFITHGHGDHTDDLLHIAKNTGALCVAPFEIAEWLHKQGIWVHPMNQGGAISFDFGRVKGVNAVHSSSFADGTYAGNPIGFLFMTGEGNFYFSGDTALTMDMQLIPLWPKPDFAVLPIGGNYTMDPYDAIHAADFVKCDRIVGIHYNTWPAISIDTDKARTDFAAAGKTLLLPGVGETISL
jgi:L-ascorbate metabolism protein UlaG (beta-lactamase superfamily)